MNRPKILPVIHHLDRLTTLSEVRVAREGGADGVFLISHHNDDDDLINIAWEAKQVNAGFPIGLNLLSYTAVNAAPKVLEAGLDMFWADSMGVSSKGLSEAGAILSAFAKAHPEIQCFASVAFKYQSIEQDPVAAALAAAAAGFIATTSGAGTGKAPDVDKIKRMGAACPLAVASGITPENVADFAPHLSHILVATGISRTEYHIDPAKLQKLIASFASAPAGATL